jgi:hypothetical protein
MTTTTDSDDPTADVEFERQVAALLEPEHERIQFERLWARIAAADRPQPSPRRSFARRWTTMLAAAAATFVFGAGTSWYHVASAPDFTTLADAPRHACGSLRVQFAVSTPAVRAAIDASGAHIVTGPDVDGIYTLTATDPLDALRTLRAVPGIRLAEPTNC